MQIPVECVFRFFEWQREEKDRITKARKEEALGTQTRVKNIMAVSAKEEERRFERARKVRELTT